MSASSGNTNLDVMQSMVEAIHEHTAATNAAAEALVADQSEARREADRRFNKQARKLRVQSWATAAVIFLLAIVIVQGIQDAAARAERTRVNEAQRKCSDTLVTHTLASLSILATATPNRVNASGSIVDPQAMARLREDIGRSNETLSPDPAVLVRIRDEVAAILSALQPDSPESHRLRDEVARSNDALLHVDIICYREHPSDDPLSGKPGN